MARSLNKVMLIGNLTRDPELKYTPSGAAVCTFGVATNRNWTNDAGEKKDDVDFHNIVVWNKLAEICAQFLKKGRKVYVEGRLSTSTWQAPDGAQRNKTEIVINDMVILDKKGEETESQGAPQEEVKTDKKSKKVESEEVKAEEKESEKVAEPDEEDIPF
ncbi:MAG TPA: single-stranded DNA-binding protein [Patescibacteria group bacterium]|nr:single-stranded DNA-binding protein [Patescibacteria group bacterium]